MTIPESQLKTWSNQGAVTTAEATHKSIRKALESHKWPDGVTYDPYLQGSYKNSTNIYGNSDVDLVVELTSCFYSNLTDAEKTQLGQTNASYTWSAFRTDVVAALSDYYGSKLVDTSGSKSVKVLADNGRLEADVVVCASYRFYENMKVRAEGMTFWTQPGWEQIINYPRLHYENGTKKNAAECTDGWYKPSVRIFKNARDRIIENDSSLKDRFPSYFTECLLYNVPNTNFGANYQDTYAHVVNWLQEQSSTGTWDKFVCQNWMQYLFGTASVQWNTADASAFVAQLIKLWNEW